MLIKCRLQSFTEPLPGLLCEPDRGFLTERPKSMDVGLTAGRALLRAHERIGVELINELAKPNAVCQRSLDELGVMDANEVRPLTHPRPSFDVGGGRIVSGRLVLHCNCAPVNSAAVGLLGEARDKHEIAIADDSRSPAIRKHPVAASALDILERRTRKRGSIAANAVKLDEGLPCISGVSKEGGILDLGGAARLVSAP